MADYSTIKGFNIQSLASDPGLPGVAGAAWSSGGALGTAVQYAGGAGTLTAGLAISGGTPGKITTTQEYDGTSWTNGGAVTTARIDAGSAGSQTSALVTGGTAPPGPTSATEEYDGTSWTAGGALSRGAARALQGSVGANQDAAWVAGGRGSPDFNDLMEEYNGTSWAESGDLNTSRAVAMAAGTTAAGLLFGGMTGDPSLTGNTNVTEEWDGTSWATSPATLNTTRREGGGSGTQTLALCFGGVGPPSNEKKVVTEAFDGSSWTEVADMATARMGGAASKIGTQTASFYAGGDSGSVSDATEEFTAGTSIAQEGQVWYNTTSTVLKGFGQSIATGAWSSGSDMVQGRDSSAGAGTSAATALVFGGQSPEIPSPNKSDLTEKYDGTSWSEVNDLNTYRAGLMGSGTQTAAFATGGYQPGYVTNMEIWDGTSWSEENNLNTARHYGGGAGTATAGLVFSGGVWNEPSKHKLTESWDGTSWTEVNNLQDDHMTNVCGVGGPAGQIAALCVSGYYYGPPVATTHVEAWDGTCWTETTAISTGGHFMGGTGTTTSALCMGGATPAPVYLANTQYFDGSTWTELADLATARDEASTAHNSSAADTLYAGGNPSSMATTEEWAATGSAIKTFTAS